MQGKGLLITPRALSFKILGKWGFIGFCRIRGSGFRVQGLGTQSADLGLLLHHLFGRLLLHHLLGGFYQRLAELERVLHLEQFGGRGHFLNLRREHFLPAVGQLVRGREVLGDGLRGRAGAVLEGDNSGLDHDLVGGVGGGSTWWL